MDSSLTSERVSGNDEDLKRLLSWFIDTGPELCEFFDLKRLAVFQWEGEEDFGFEFVFNQPHEVVWNGCSYEAIVYRTECLRYFHREIEDNQTMGPCPLPVNRRRQRLQANRLVARATRREDRKKERARKRKRKR